MSVILPKRGNIEKVYPFDTSAHSKSTGATGAFGAYTQIVASTTADFVCTGVYTNVVFSEAAASVSGAVPYQMQIATGVAASEVPFGSLGGAAGVQYGHNASNAQLGMAQLHRIPPTLIPAGSRLSCRAMALAIHLLLVGIYVVGYEPTRGFALPRPWGIDDDNLEYYQRAMKTAGSELAPSGSFTAISSHATVAWSYGTTVEYIASAATDILVTAVLTNIVTPVSVSTHEVIEIGIGASGSEVWSALVALPCFVNTPGPGGGELELPRPLYVKQGERVACRMKGTQTKTIDVALIYTILQ